MRGLGTRSASFLADKMDVDPINWSYEVIKPIYSLLLLSPIKFYDPVVTKLSQVVQICAVVPPSNRLAFHATGMKPPAFLSRQSFRQRFLL